MLKNIFLWFEDIRWNVKCRYAFWLYGPYGLTRVVERMPFRFLLKYMRLYGASIGENCIIDSGVKFHRPDKKKPFVNLILGNNVYIGHNLLVDLTDQVIFEDNTALGANCQVWTHVGDYKFKLRDKNDYSEKIGKVLFKEGFVGYSGALFNPGTVLGKHARVLALSMVSGTIPNGEIWGGVPAKFIKNRDLTN